MSQGRFSFSGKGRTTLTAKIQKTEGTDTLSEYGEFESLARKLVAVPKSEIDAKRRDA